MDEADVIIEEVGDSDEDTPEIDEKGNILRIDHADGSISVSLDGSPLGSVNEDRDDGWFQNIAEEADQLEMSRIAEELLRGIDADIQSRSDWIEDRAQGLRLLGLKIEIPGVQGASDGAPVEGMSKVRHPLLLEAVLRFQANSRSELLPTDGPVKTRTDSNNGSARLDELAKALEKDMNHYLTTTATEYYPDTDRMLFMLGFGGTSFKKVYHCPLRNRPVSESIDADDLIVNNLASDLDNAKRITHRIMMRPSVVKRMQLIGAYRDIDLHDPKQVMPDAAQEEKLAQQGISPNITNAEDRDREIYECYCELDIAGYEHKKNGKVTGLEIPYRVTIDVSSRQILSIMRNFDEDTRELPIARKVFVKYPFVPGLGFYDIGLLHILGNTTNAVTAAWRELLDAGMYANFPGFLYADAGGRQNTNIFRVPPGGGAAVKTGGMPLNQAIMPLPYKEPSAALAGLVQSMVETGQRVGGTAEMGVGEGKQDAPVGTTLALIEQATKVLSSVHKRLHAAQSEEFQLLKECFKDNPESFWQRNNTPAYPWDQATFLEALENIYIIPQADPNTASQTQRMMKTQALVQLAMASPQMFNMDAVNRQALRTIGYDNADEFLKPQDGNVPPEMMEKVVMAKIADKQATAAETTAQANMIRAQTDAQSKAADAQFKGMELQMKANAEGMAEGGGVQPNPVDAMEAQAKLIAAQAKAQEVGVKQQELEVTHKDIVLDGQNRAAERQSREKLAGMRMQENEMKMTNDLILEMAKPKPVKKKPGLTGE
jgi:uncharacterized protein YdhG (YjbR/CyaY superfamily)